MKTEEKVFTFLFLIVIVTMGVLTFQFRASARLFPLIIGGITLTLAILLVLMAVFPRLAALYRSLEGEGLSLPTESSLGLDPMEGLEPGTIRKREFFAMGWLTTLMVFAIIFGFLAGVPLFLFLFSRFGARDSWLASLVLAGGIGGIVYLFFSLLLNVPLYEGLLFDYLL